MIKLYSYFRSSSSYRARIALNLKGLEYEIIPVHLVKDGGEQFSESFKKLNPSSKVPVLIHDEEAYFQSVSLIEYLDETFPENPLYPKSAKDRARVRTLCEIINSDIQPLQNLRVLKKLVKDCGLSEEQKLGWIQNWISEGFATYEGLLKTTAGQFSFGDKPSAADAFLIPQIYNAVRFEMDLSLYPLISRVNENALKLDAFIKAHPDNQPDTPKE